MIVFMCADALSVNVLDILHRTVQQSHRYVAIVLVIIRPMNVIQRINVVQTAESKDTDMITQHSQPRVHHISMNRRNFSGLLSFIKKTCDNKT